MIHDCWEIQTHTRSNLVAKRTNRRRDHSPSHGVQLQIEIRDYEWCWYRRQTFLGSVSPFWWKGHANQHYPDAWDAWQSIWNWHNYNYRCNAANCRERSGHGVSIFKMHWIGLAYWFENQLFWGLTGVFKIKSNNGIFMILIVHQILDRILSALLAC